MLIKLFYSVIPPQKCLQSLTYYDSCSWLFKHTSLVLCYPAVLLFDLWIWILFWDVFCTCPKLTSSLLVSVHFLSGKQSAYWWSPMKYPSLYSAFENYLLTKFVRNSVISSWSFPCLYRKKCAQYLANSIQQIYPLLG